MRFLSSAGNAVNGAPCGADCAALGAPINRLGLEELFAVVYRGLSHTPVKLLHRPPVYGIVRPLEAVCQPPGHHLFWF